MSAADTPLSARDMQEALMTSKRGVSGRSAALLRLFGAAHPLARFLLPLRTFKEGRESVMCHTETTCREPVLFF
jgi:hypothetical protein